MLDTAKRTVKENKLHFRELEMAVVIEDKVIYDIIFVWEMKNETKINR